MAGEADGKQNNDAEDWLKRERGIRRISIDARRRSQCWNWWGKSFRQFSWQHVRAGSVRRASRAL